MKNESVKQGATSQETSLTESLPLHNKVRPKSGVKVSLSYEEVINKISEFDVDSPKLYDESFALFNDFQSSNNLTDNDLDSLLNLIEGKLNHLWIPFMVKVAVSICQSKSPDKKLIAAIRKKSVVALEKHGIPEGELTTSEKNFNMQKSDKFITQFLSNAEKYAQKKDPINAQDLACLTFICFSLACKQYNVQGTEYVKAQLLIDRSVSEYVSSSAHATVREKDLVAKTLGHMLSAKVYSPKKISELTFLYSGTSDKLSEQESKIQSLEDTCKAKSSRINFLVDEIKAEKSHTQELQQQIEALIEENKKLSAERSEAENLLSYEKNKYQKQLESREEGIAGQLTATISLELEALKDLVQYLGEDDQRRFSRRLNRIDQYLQDFGGDK